MSPDGVVLEPTSVVNDGSISGVVSSIFSESTWDNNVSSSSTWNDIKSTLMISSKKKKGDYNRSNYAIVIPISPCNQENEKLPWHVATLCFVENRQQIIR